MLLRNVFFSKTFIWKFLFKFKHIPPLYSTKNYSSRKRSDKALHSISTPTPKQLAFELCFPIKLVLSPHIKAAFMYARCLIYFYLVIYLWICMCISNFMIFLYSVGWAFLIHIWSSERVCPGSWLVSLPVINIIVCFWIRAGESKITQKYSFTWFYHVWFGTNFKNWFNFRINYKLKILLGIVCVR